MAEYGTPQVSRIEPLTGNNYYTWALKVGAVLKSRRLFKPIIEGNGIPNIGQPGSVEQNARDKWEEQNDDAFGIIILTLAPEQAAQFINETNAKKVWEELKNTYAGNIEDRKIDIQMELKNLKMGENENVDSYLTRAKCISSKSASLGHVVPIRELVFHVVRGLNRKMEGIAAILRTQRSASMEEIQQALSEEETRLGNSLRQEKYEKAYKVREGNKSGMFNNNKRCFVCNKVGHLANQCWHRKSNERIFDGKNKIGNNAKFHGTKNTRFERKNEQAKVARENPVEHAFGTYKGEQYELNNHWNLDSGCTSHMSPYVDWMDDFEQMNSTVNLAGEDNILQIKGKGNIRVSIVDNEGYKKNILIRNVLYVPNLRTNLLSVSCLINQGNKVVFDDQGATIWSKEDKIIAQARQENRMYTLETTTKRHTENSDFECMVVEGAKNENSKIHENEKWHKRLGHVNEAYLKRMHNCGMVRGLYLNHKKLPICRSCLMGKMPRDTFKSVESLGEFSILELVHIDLCGPMPVESLGGSKYILVIIDTFSRRMFVEFLKTKDEAYEKFVNFMNRWENETQRKIKAVRSDNGSEFVNKRFDQLFKSKGINHQRTTFYSPQSNGITERGNRTLLESARTMMIDAELTPDFWAEAVATAAYVHNCTPNASDNDKTPMEKWTGKLPSVKHMRVFGCVAFYHIPEALRNKLEPRAKEGIFIGYSKERKAYRVYDPKERKIHEVRTIKCLEDKRGGFLIDSEDDKVNSRQNQLNLMLLPFMEPVEIENDKQDEGRQNQQEQATSSLGGTQESLRERHQQARLENEGKLPEMGVRRSDRIQNRNKQTTMMTTESVAPKNFEELELSTFRDEWRTAMDEEMNSLTNHKVWELVDREPGMKVINSKWVFTLKKNPDGTIDKRKARLVAAGYGLSDDTKLEDTFSPVMKMESFRTLMAIAADRNMIIKQYDVKTAYLYGEVKEDLYLKQPQGYIQEGEESKICKLKKSIYGLPQSGKNWNNKINAELIKCGLVQLQSDPCIYVKHEGDKLFIMGLYVDDKIVLGNDNAIINSVMDQLKEIFVLVEKPEPRVFLGIQINDHAEGIILSQSAYVKEILARFGLEFCNITKTPGDPRQDLDQHEESAPADKSKYQEMIGSLMYLSNGTRPDIAYIVSKLSQYISNPKLIHMVACKRVYRYLKGTQDKGLLFSRKVSHMEGSADASWCNTPDAKSMSGYTVKLGTSLISWRSKNQSLVALSTCEAEMMSICECLREIKWIVSLIAELDLNEYIQLPITIFSDSQAAINWIKGVVPAARTKHINRKYFFVREEYKKGNIVLMYKGTNDMEADLLTKSLSVEKLQSCISLLGLV